MIPRRLFPIFITIVPAVLPVTAIAWEERRGVVERLEPAHLEALHQKRLEWAKTRKEDPLPGIYQDYRAVMHVHAEDAPHTLGTRAQVLEGAKAAGVRVVMSTDHRGPKADSWSGVHDGVLFIAGSEDDHQLTYPGAVTPLRFLSHTEEVMDKDSEGYQGIEIYNRHTDFARDTAFVEYFKKAMAEPEATKQFAAKLKQYPDEVFAAGTGRIPELLKRWDAELTERPFTAIAANDAHRNQIYNGLVLDPYDVAFRNVSTHILATELTESAVRRSLAEGRAYVAHDWLCDPQGFYFWAFSNLGMFNIGDSIPLERTTRLEVRLPVAGRVRFFHDGRVVHQAEGRELQFAVKEPGAYRVEVSLEADGEERPWIYSNAIFVSPGLGLNVPLSAMAIDASVEATKNIAYVEGGNAKQKLDLYLPREKKDFPVLVFVHGGSWTSGDRALYQPLGNHFAKMGIGVVIPSYRLMPQTPYPGAVEDVAAAIAWTVRNIKDRGGDPARIYVSGHSAGGHLVSLVMMEEARLKKAGAGRGDIRGVMTLSGVYDVAAIPVFGGAEARREASPAGYMTSAKTLPPFLVTYCQWDYPYLPYQARQFAAALDAAGVKNRLVYVPGVSHITEVLHMMTPDDITINSMLRFMETGRP